MKNEDKVLNKLKNVPNQIERKIKYRKLYNIRNYFMRYFLKSCIGVYKVSPFIISSLIMLLPFRNNLPFKKDIVKSKAIIHTIDDSKGSHIEMTADKSNNYIEYSTKWFLNKDGKYERHVSYYGINTEYDIDKILKMTLEELSSVFTLEKKDSIIKSLLTNDDDIYCEDVMVISSSYETTDVLLREESDIQNLIMSIAFLFSSLILGGAIFEIRKIFIKRNIGDILTEYIPYYINYDEDELKNLLDISIKNYQYINSDIKTKILRMDVKNG